MSEQVTFARTPVWFRAVIGLSILWNVFGVYQFATQTFADETMLLNGGMTAAQAALYAGLPVWMPIAFGVGTIGGLIGTLLLLAGRQSATPVLGLSLAGYIVLYIGDMTEGVFAAFGTPQVVILSSVVAIAVGLLMLARLAARRGWLK
ncbi:MAG: hypothetical protein SFV20_03760 [Sphingopyxis sp.]|nr:hypothetical protein [Sphingopyxis sp.]